jgi:3-oxoacyl-[acyl-carrier protein] reductase
VEEREVMGILDGKTGVVTGGGRGIGRGHCLVLAQEGMKVVVNDVDAEEAEKVVKEISGAGGTAIANSDDIGTREGAEALVARCVSRFGRIDAMVANAGIVRDRTLLNMTDEEFDEVIRIHLKGTFLCGQAAARRMREQGTGGAIVNTTSGAQMGNYGQTNYSAAKGGIASMTYTWAGELARFGIRVNAIAPAASTRMTANVRDPKTGQPADQVRFLDPALNAPLVAYLCSDEGSWVTGQVFGVGGERLTLTLQPRYADTLIHPGGWTVAAVREHFRNYFGTRLEPFGLAKRPYAYYGGVKPEAS